MINGDQSTIHSFAFATTSRSFPLHKRGHSEKPTCTISSDSLTELTRAEEIMVTGWTTVGDRQTFGLSERSSTLSDDHTPTFTHSCWHLSQYPKLCCPSTINCRHWSDVWSKSRITEAYPLCESCTLTVWRYVDWHSSLYFHQWLTNHSSTLSITWKWTASL